MKFPYLFNKTNLFTCVMGFVFISQINAQVKPTTTNAPPSKTSAIPPATYPSSLPVNYIRAWEPSMPTTDPNAVRSTSRTTAEVKQTTQYFDGLGRPLQTVTKKITPGSRDLVAPVVYDEFGREVYKYLPYPQTTANTNDGKFKLNPFNNQNTAIQDLNLYPGEDVYYGKTDYEVSPLNRVLKMMAPGNNWAGSDRGVSQSYKINTVADSVHIWKVDSVAGSLPINYYYIDYTYYPGTLYKNVTADENGNKTVTFKDTDGRLILKKTALSAEPAGAHAGWLCTYYMYDNTGNLRFVMPPKAVEYLEHNIYDWPITQTLADELCFRYEYDHRRRMTIKKVPGAGEVQMVYDNRDRLVFSQDAVQRANHQWLVTFYDGLNRPIETGIYTDATATRQSLQAALDALAGGGGGGGCGQVAAPNDLVVSSRTGNQPSEYVARNSITFMPGFEAPAGDEFTTTIDLNAMIDDPNCGGGGSSGGNPVPPISMSAVTPLTYTYYDDYTWSGHQAFQSSYLAKVTAAGNNYSESPSTYSNKTKGSVTGSRVRVLNSSPEKWLTTTTYYDDKGRMLQTLSSNATGGTDIVTNKYDFSGKLLSSYVVNHNNESAVTPETRVLTEDKYDAAGRLLTVTKTINDVTTSKRVIASNTYNELGQLKEKKLGLIGTTPIETLTYEYNIRGWLRGINRGYANGSGSNYFGMELNYDYGFSQNQYNGNIAGEKWRSSGDGERRAYGFSYDAASRFTKGDFTQYTGGWNQNAGVNYNVSNLTYDANGNILGMKRMGLITTSSGTVDNLGYTYQSNSNKLDHVTDNGGTSAALGDFKDVHTTAGDYDYDVNGNLTKDLNKSISTITYNHLNLPETVNFGSKGNIKFVYDAAGNKLQKIVTDNTASPSRTITTDYINGFVYQNDSLQFFGTEEGRVRYVPAHGSTAAAYVYDYFIKDHLGNTRVVLTEQTDFSQYLATMETQNAQTEDALFYNVNNTREAKPLDYPQDNTTTPNTAVAKLNGSDPDKRVGPSIILKVMAGDTIEAAVRAFYRQQATTQNNAGVPAEEMAISLMQALSLPAQAAAATHTLNQQARRTSPRTGLTANDLQALKQKDPDKIKDDKPKAYLNYVFFDKQFNFVDDGSGIKQVDGEPNQLETLASGKVVAKKNGYVYVYTSNESQQDVLFDNFGVTQITGPVLEETHYYPFGLTMAGISNMAPLKLEGRRKFNGIEFNHKEFSDGSGLNLYTAKFRGLDPQIGRWWQIDPKPDMSISPYSAMTNNPIIHMDFLGDTIIGDLKAKQQYSNAVNKGINNGVKKVNTLLQKSLHATGNKLKSLNRRIAKAQKNLNEFTAARNEFNTLESSTQNYNIITGVTSLSANKYGTTVNNPSTGNVDVKISASAPNLIGTVAHELKHAYQYETHEASLMYNGIGSGDLTDLHDELAAFRRGQLFGDNASVNFTIPLLQKKYPTDPIGPINTNTPYPGTKDTYGDAIKKQIILLKQAGRPPIVIIKGWQNY